MKIRITSVDDQAYLVTDAASGVTVGDLDASDAAVVVNVVIELDFDGVQLAYRGRAVLVAPKQVANDLGGLMYLHGAPK